MKRAEAIALRQQIESAATLQTDEVALDSKWMYATWQTDTAYEVGSRVRYGDKLYKCNIAHISQDDWRPDKPSALWSEVSADEWAEWKPPTGAHDAYNVGDKCSYQGKHWVCDANGNVFPPPTNWHEV